MAETKDVLLVGATGTVGREASLATLAAGGRARALVRSRTSADRLAQGIEPVFGDLREEAAVRRALSGVRAALYVSPHEPDEAELAERFVRRCEASGVRLVFVGVHVDGSTRLGRALQRFVYGRMLPHYRPKFRIAERARTCKAQPVVLMPTNFYQNDELFRAEIEAGSLPQPFAQAINRVDVRDLGAAAARALLDASLPAGAYPVIGPSSLTGDACAAHWSRALGRTVRCEPDRVEQALARALDGKKRADFQATYSVLRRFALKTDPQALARTAALLGRAPIPYERYVADMARAWAADSSANTAEIRRTTG